MVVEVDEPTRFSFSWDFQANRPYNEATAQHVEITLTPDGENTRLTLVESGFAQLPDDLYQENIDANSAGWDAELGDLVAYVGGLEAS